MVADEMHYMNEIDVQYCVIMLLYQRQNVVKHREFAQEGDNIIIREIMNRELVFMEAW